MAKKLDETGAKSNLTPEVFIDFVSKLNTLSAEHQEKAEEAKTAKSAISAWRKHGKKVLGVDLCALSMFQELRNADSEDASLRIKTLARYAAYMRMPWGTQMEMFGKLDEAPPTQEHMEMADRANAEEQGRLRGAAGDSADDNPHPGGSAAHVGWHAGWKNGYAFYSKSQGSGADVRKPAGRKGRANPEDRAAS